MGFKEYFFKRILDSFVTWIFVLILNFLLFYSMSSETRLQSFTGQMVEYLSFVFIQRFGLHPYTKQPVLDYIMSFSVYSFILLALSLAIAIGIGVFLGTIASYKQGKKIDAALTLAVLIPSAFPIWWIGQVLRIYLHPPFPAFFWYPEKWFFQSAWTDMLSFIPDFLNHLVLPLSTFVLALTGIYFIVTRNSLRDVHTEDYMTTAKAKGLGPVKIMFKHALRNAIIPVISIIALTPSLLVLGIMMVEHVFSRGGLGSMLLQSAVDPGWMNPVPPTPILQALFIVSATMVIILHFVVDISISVLDPRTRVDGAGLGSLDKKVVDNRHSERFFARVVNFLKKFMKGYSGKFGVGVIAFFAIMGLIVPFVPLPDPLGTNLQASKNEPPSLTHILGTDWGKRDVLAMIMWGARTSLVEGLGAVALALAIGCLVGLFAGYFRGNWIGYLLDRLTDLLISVPIIILVVYFPMGPSSFKWILAVGLTTWPVTAKLVRAAVVSAKEKPFIEASRAAGAGNTYIIFHRLLPECLPAIASSMLFLVVTALSVQSSLDFLGFQRNLWSLRLEPVTVEPYISWGTMLAYGAGTYTPLKQWWLIFPPGICIALLVLALLAIGNKMIEITNPKLASKA